MGKQPSLGKLYGVGVGPGDPNLLTLKALKVIQEVPYLFVASSSKNHYSLALRVISPHLPPKKEVKRLAFPMTYDQGKLKAAWRKNAHLVLQSLQKGDVAFLTLGDPCLYSTFGYLVRELQAQDPSLEFEIVPGITAAQAAAARLKLSLAEKDETILILPGIKGKKAVSQWAKEVDTLILYKVYRQAQEILEALDNTQRLKDTRAISFCGMPEEEVFPTPPQDKAFPYFTLFLVGGKNLKK